MENSSLTQGKIWKGLLLFAIPLFGTSLIQQVYNMVDLMFVGQLVGKEASAAVGSTSLFIACVVSFFNGIGIGVGVVVAHHYGAKEEKKVSQTIHTAAWLTVVGVILVAAIFWFATPGLLPLMNVSGQVETMAQEYMRTYFLGIFTVISYNVSAGILRALGDSRRPMIYQLIGCGANILLDALLIGTFQMGVVGAALATVLSQLLAALCSIRCLWHLPENYRLRLSQIGLQPAIAGRILKIGIPAAIQSMLISFANLMLQSQINLLGVNSMAAYAAYTKVEGMLYYPQWAVGQANTMYVGQNIGAGQVKRAEQSTRIALLMDIGIMIVVGALAVILAPWLFRLFATDPDVVALAVKTGRTTYWLYFLYGFVEVLAGALRGSGESFGPMLITILNMCGVRLIVLRILMCYVHTLNQVALVFPITWVTTGLSMVLYYKFGRWRKRIGLDRMREKET